MCLPGGLRLCCALLAAVPHIGAVAQVPAAQHMTARRARWNEPVTPFRIVGETWYVGPRGVAVLAIRTSKGVIRIDAALPESAPQIVDNLATLGIVSGDIRLLLSSEAPLATPGGCKHYAEQAHVVFERLVTEQSGITQAPHAGDVERPIGQGSSSRQDSHPADTDASRPEPVDDREANAAQTGLKGASHGATVRSQS